MKTTTRTRLLAMFAVIASLLGGWAVAQVKQPNMEMMKKMMMSRPAVMKKADDAVQKYKMKAMQEGKYGCCLKHPCDFCALKMGQCPCGMHAKNDMPVCNECKGGWYAGDGAVPGKTADQIYTLPRPVMPMK